MARTVYGGSGKQRTSVLGGRYTQSSNPTPSGVPQGSPGGVTNGTKVRAASRKPGMRFRIGDEGYLWILVIIEMILTVWLRHCNRQHHGG